MRHIDSETKSILAELIAFLVPLKMTPKERRTLAGKAGLNANSLRVGIHRRSIGADTLIRLLLARGISSKLLKELPQTDHTHLSQGDSEWLTLGRQLEERERLEFVKLVRYLQIRWDIR